MINKQLPFYIDLIFCIILLPLLIVLLPIERLLVNNMIFSCMLISWLYATYFLNRLIIIPRLLKKHKYTIILILLLAVTAVVTYYIADYSPAKAFRRGLGAAHRNFNSQQRGLPKIQLQQQAVWFLYVVVISFSCAVGLLTELYNQIVARQSIEFEKKKAELALYKAQINPHFLFNTLNTLYGFLISKSDNTESAFMQFINIVKYMYTNGIKDKISIEDEMEYIKQYIELQKNRLNKFTTVNYSFTNDNELFNAKIAPMLLITFIENAFKYGVASHSESEISINLSLQNGTLHLNVNNTIVSLPKDDNKSGIGLQNCIDRLKLLYPNKHKLETSNTDNIYTVSLTIQLD